MVEGPPLVAAVVVLGVASAVRSDVVSLSRQTVLAAAPWAVAAGAVVVAGRAGVYEGTAVSTGVLLAALAGAAAGSWILLSHLAALRNLPYRERYLAAAGLGAAIVVVAALAGHAEAVPASVVWLAIAPVVAGLLAAGGYFALGLVYTDALVAFRLAGLYAIGTVVFDGAASAVAETLGHDERGIVTEALVAALETGGVEFSGWFLLPVHAVLAVAFVGCCGWLARRRGTVGNGCALAGSALALGSATVVLLSATLLG